MPALHKLSLAALVCVAAAQDASSTSSAPTSMETGIVMLPAEVENCHAHGTEYFCFAGEEEWEITSENAAEYDGQSLTACEAGTAENSISCDATDGSEVTLLRENAEGAEEDHDHSHDDSTSTAMPTEVTNCHAHEESILCFAGEDEWEIISENAASYDGQNLTACETGAQNSTISCNSEEGTAVTLTPEAHSEEDHNDEGNSTTTEDTTTTEEDTTEEDTTEEDTAGEGNAGSAIMASVSFSVVGLVLAAFVL